MNKANNSKLLTRKWNIANDQSNANVEVLKSNLYDYNDVYISLRGTITIIGHQVTQVAFKNCAPFFTCFTKIDGTTIDDAEGLYLVMPIYNLIEYSSNYSETTGSLWFFFQKMKQLILMQILLIPIILNLSCIRQSKILKLMKLIDV